MRRSSAPFASFARGVRILCVLALVMVGFGHKPVDASSVADLFAAYTLPDGTLPTLCVTDDSSKSDPGKTPIWHGCEACRLAAAVLIPQLPEALAARVTYYTVPKAFARQLHMVKRLFPPSAAPRAPPVENLMI
jgi:hypothetical protein